MNRPRGCVARSRARAHISRCVLFRYPHPTPPPTYASCSLSYSTPVPMLYAASRTHPPPPSCASRWIHPRRPQPTRHCCTFLSRASNTLATLSRCASGVNDRSADGQSGNGALRAVNWRRRRAQPPKPLLSRVHPCMGPRPPHSSHACGVGEGAHARGRVASVPATR